MSAGAAWAQALAYVDDCLAAEEKPEFERRMASDPGLAARVAQWRMQNEAIRRAFDGDNRLVRNANDSPESEPAEAPREIARSIPLRRDFGRRRDPPEEDFRQRRPASDAAPPPGRMRSVERQSAANARRFGRGCCALLAAVFLCMISAAPAPSDRSPLIAATAFSAYRTFASSAAKETEFATSETTALERWLQPQLGGWIAIPSLSAGGFTLLGGRVIPGAQGPAAFALYRNRAGARIGLAVESGETAPEAAFVRASGGLIAIAIDPPGSENATIVGRAGEAELDRLARLARFAVARRR